MYAFAIVAMLALATVKLVDFLSDAVPMLRPMRSLATFVVSIGAVLALDYSLFDGFGITVRNHAMGLWATGMMVAGMTVTWRAVFGYLTHDKAASDETLGEHRVIRAA